MGGGGGGGGDSDDSIFMKTRVKERKSNQLGLCQKLEITVLNQYRL